jgi:hypothetical protein
MPCRGTQPLGEWTVSFANSGVVGWTEEDAWSQDRPPSLRHRTRGGEPATRRQFSHKQAREACAAWPA